MILKKFAFAFLIVVALTAGSILFVVGSLIADSTFPGGSPNANRAPGADERPATAPDAPSETEPAATPPQGSLTYDNYLRVTQGMTYDEVVTILGSEGTEVSRSHVAGYTTVMYAWQKWTGANMNAMFQNGRLITKAQFGFD